MNTSIAIIPARGGSKRLPGKNVKNFLGKPIIAYSIEAALHSGQFREVMVSTDDPEIAKIAEKFGAVVPFLRSSVNANDFATTYDVIAEVLAVYGYQNINFELGCCIYPTAPFVTSALLSRGKQLLLDNKFDSVFPVLEYSFPIWRSLKLENGKAEYCWPENAAKRSQDLPRSYHDAGQFYWFNTSAILSKKTLISDNSGGLFVDEMHAQDIDTINDWKLAELKYKILVNETQA